MSEEATTQLDLEKGLTRSGNESSSPEAVQKSKVDMEDSGSKIESPTPEKPESRRKGVVVSSMARNLLAERYKDRFAGQLSEDDEDETDDEKYDVSGTRPADTPIELLERHKILLNLFNRMESSIRLLRLRKKMTTFQNIATQVEVLTKRKFLYNHLAQMKHLFPEAIQIKRILLHDEKSLCMYPDMEITLVMDVVECNSPDQSPSMAICEAFYTKLLGFLDAHDKDKDIPEAILPEPFNSRPKESLYLRAMHDRHSAEPPLQISADGVSNASHFPHSFQKLISQKIIADGTEKTQLLCDPAELGSMTAYYTERLNTSPKKQDMHVPDPVKPETSATPNRRLITCCQERTPKQGTSDSPLMTETPAMQTPKRPLPTPLDKHETACGHVSEPRSTSSARRTLMMYSPLKLEGNASCHDVNTAKLEVSAKKGLFSEETSSFTNLLEENDPVPVTGEEKSSEEGPAQTHEKLASLRATFDLVCDFSQSIKNSLITKQELFHYILANNLEIEEAEEIEEQLHILEDLAPDWISKKVHGGEILYSIEQIPNQNSVRARLVEVV